ncbi:Toxin Afp18 [Pandoraea aquatica]|uniref:Toxin Afp18 n=1 Tax=Pandoraea aquatica TaxID=2508290 RepID=A0A5E4Y4R8_9BURK|nr:DUF6543 domain-containing protein [Pandoraea aquatica]VVE43554.1 Toxin Afp18 [Pandoraea aquatica]
MQAIVAGPSNSTASIVPTDHTPPTARTHDVDLAMERFGNLADVARARLDESPVTGPALALLVHMTTSGISPDDLAALDAVHIEKLARLFDTQPRLASACAATLANQLAERGACESVEEICERILSDAALYDLSRSVAGSSEPLHDSCRHGSGWLGYFMHWRDVIVSMAQDFRWLGSGVDPLTGPTSMRPPDEKTTGPAPFPDFTKSGKTGWLLGALYASSLRPTIPMADVSRIPPDIAPHLSVPSLTKPPPSTDTPPSGARLPTLASVCQELSTLATGIPERALAMLDYIVDHVSLPAWPGPPVAGAAVPPMVTTGKTRITPQPLPPIDKLGSLQAISPEMSLLIESALIWRYRAAVHGDLTAKFDEALTFESPPSEGQLFEKTVMDAPEFAGKNMTDLWLRRHEPIPDGQRLKQVTYWSLPAAAQLIVDGDLDICDLTDGTSFDVSTMTPEGAVKELPMLMTAERFQEIVLEWEQATQAREAATWMVPQEVTRLGRPDSPDTLFARLAQVDLRLTYKNGLLPRHAAYVADWAVARLLVDDASSIPETFARRVTFNVTSDLGHRHVSPAGTFVVCEQPDDGATLLYMRGEPIAWRAFESPPKLIDAIRNNTAGLRDRLFDRLPLGIRPGASCDLSAPILQDMGKAGGPEIATRTILDVIELDAPLPLAGPKTRARISDYRAWLIGTPTAAFDEGIKARRAARETSAHAMKTFISPMSPSDMRGVIGVRALRHTISVALPRFSKIARDHLRGELMKLGLPNADPDNLYVKIDQQPRPMALTDALTYASAYQHKRVFPDVYTRHGANDYYLKELRTASGTKLKATDLVNRRNIGAFLESAKTAIAEFWRQHRAHVRETMKSEFVAQMWLQHTAGELSAAHLDIATRIAGPIKLAGMDRSNLAQTIDNPDVEREWLSVQGNRTGLMSVRARGHSPLLLLAMFPDGLSCRGFGNRAALETWFVKQTADPTTRRRLAGTIAQRDPDDNAWLKDARPDAVVTTPALTGDTFTLLESAYETAMTPRTPAATNTTDHSVAIRIMRSISAVDLAAGLGSWIVPELRPLGEVISAVDFGAGVIAVSVSYVDGDEALRAQGWQSMLTAVGSQGISLVQYKAMAWLPGNSKYTYFVDDAPVAAQRLIPGLYRENGRLYASVASDARAYVSFDDATGFFRLEPLDLARVRESEGPLIRLDERGRWHTVPQGSTRTPPLDERGVGWNIDRGFWTRYNALRRERSDIFENARTAVADGPMPAPANSVAEQRWRARMLKLEFIDAAESDREKLGTLVGRIDQAQNALDSMSAADNSPLMQQATAAGASFLPITQRPLIYLGHARTGVMRATAVAADTGSTSFIVECFNTLARGVGEDAQGFMEDLSELGRAHIRYKNVPFDAPKMRQLSTLFDGLGNEAHSFEVRAGTRTLLLGKYIDDAQATKYYFVDPSLALVVHDDAPELLRMVFAHLQSMSGAYEMRAVGNSLAVETLELDTNDLATLPLRRDFDNLVSVREAFGL